MNLTEAQSAPITLSNARQLVLNEDSYMVRRVDNKTAILRRDMLKVGVAVETLVNGKRRYVRVYGQLEEALNALNDMVEDWKCI